MAADSQNTFFADYMKQTGNDEKSPESRNKLGLKKQSSSISYARQQTLSKKKRNRSISILKSKPFHIEAEKANGALDFNKMIVDDKALKS